MKKEINKQDDERLKEQYINADRMILKDRRICILTYLHLLLVQQPNKRGKRGAPTVVFFTNAFHLSTLAEGHGGLSLTNIIAPPPPSLPFLIIRSFFFPTHVALLSQFYRFFTVSVFSCFCFCFCFSLHRHSLQFHPLSERGDSIPRNIIIRISHEMS